MPPAALEVNNLTKLYGSFRAVDDVSFAVPSGTVVGLLGPNGAGKTTTIQMLLGITELTDGTITYFGDDFRRHRRRCLQRINFTSAYNTLQGQLSVIQNLRVFSRLYSVGNADRRIEELSAQLEITPLLGQTYWNLSAGQRTRVGLVKALLNDPDMLMMDEPTASLDPDIRDKTLSLIERLRDERGLSLLYTSHQMDEVARLCDEVIFLDKGRVVMRDTPANLTRAIGSAEVVLSFEGDASGLERQLTGGGRTFVLESSRRIAVRVASEELASVISDLHTAPGVVVTEVEIRKPTLEDVFLKIARTPSE